MQAGKRGRFLILGVYLLIITILFCLPGSVFPPSGWRDAIFFDKWVHVMLFVGLSVVSAWNFTRVYFSTFLVLFLSLALYGLLIEVIQDAFVVNRSFELGD